MTVAKVILGAVDRLRLDKKSMIALCYAGAAAMSSLKVGVAAHVQQVAPLANYCHCSMHGLNLAASRISVIRAVKNAQGTMETAIVFVTDSAKRAVVLQQAQKRTSQSTAAHQTLRGSFCRALHIGASLLWTVRRHRGCAAAHV